MPKLMDVARSERKNSFILPIKESSALFKDWKNNNLSY